MLISTGTRPLQDQIFYKDLPALRRALGHDVRAAYMKGRTNYLCLHRLDRLREAAAGLPPADRAWLERIADWVNDTQTGDRAEIDDLPDDLPLWSDVSTTSEQCLGRDCPVFSSCFVTRMREAAAEADIVVVNHHLLCADAAVRQGGFGEVIPECDLTVIDEAHQLEDVVTNYFGVSVTLTRVDEFARDGSRAAGLLPPEAATFAVALVRAMTDAQQSRAASVRRRPAPAADTAGRLRRSRHHHARHGVAPVRSRPRPGRGARAIRARGREPANRLRGTAGPCACAHPRRGVAPGRGAPDDARRTSATCISSSSAAAGVQLRAAPIDPSGIIRDAVVGDRYATVLTSATLSVEGSFDYALGRLGLPDAVTLSVPSEFDYRTQALLYLPADMPDPRSRDFNRAAAAEVEALLDCSQGRAFVLFTSYAAMREVRDEIDGRVPWPLLVQGEAPRSALLRDFRATPNAVLLATASFWQGIDVAGEALSCVIIDRLPFASPGDPHRGRQDRGGPGARRPAVSRLPGAAGHVDASPGSRAAHSDARGSRACLPCSTRA